MARTSWKKKRLPTSSRIRIYQDESGMHKKDPFLILGFLLMDESVERHLEKELGSIAAAENVVGEVHFRELKQDVSGCSGAKFLVLKRWLGELHKHLTSGTVWLTILAVDKKKIDRERVPEDYMLYNRFSRIGIEATLSRYARTHDTGTARVIVHCDAHCLKMASEGVLGDNYEQYLRKQLRVSFNKKSEEKGRSMALRGVRVRLEDSEESRILQLVDGVLGATRQHVMNDARRLPKVLLAQLVGRWLSESASGVIPLGRLSAQVFPNDEGTFSRLT